MITWLKVHNTEQDFLMFKYMINIIWYGSFRITSRINPRPISSLELKLSGWYWCLGLIRDVIRKEPYNMGRSPNYGRNSNIFHITNGLNSLHRKWYTGNQYMVKSAENRMCSNLEWCRTFRNLVVSYQVVSYLDRDVSYRGKHV